VKHDPSIRIGPAGWSYDDWKGIVYPDGMRSHALEWLCKVFDTVEVNATFYRPIPPRTTAKWAGLVADNGNFRFTVKLWQRFTHERDQQPNELDVQLFRESVKPLLDAGRLGAVLVQFPWSFKRTRENRIWLGQTLDAFSDLPLTLEVRHASWDRPEVHRGLAERGIAFCNIDQPIFRDSLEPTERTTSRIGYVRLHGRNAEDWFREDAGRDDRYDYLYSEEELRPWVEKIERMRSKVDEMFVITNNHYRGQAVVNAFDLQAGLGQREFVLPEHLVEEYPRLKRLVASAE